MKNCYCFIFFLLQSTLGILAQDQAPQYNSIDDALNFYLLDVESGLSNNYINSIEQDALGFMWIATADGLNRYDGTQFVKYRSDSNNALTNNNISQVEYDHRKEELVLGTDKGLNRYLPKIDKFKAYCNTNDSLKEFVKSFTFDPKGNLVVSMLRNRQGLYILNEEKIIQSFMHESGNENSLSSNEITSLAMQNDSILWIGTFDGGLNKMNYSTKEITRIKNSRFSKQINEVYVDLDNNVWVGTKEGIQVITTTKDTLSLKNGLSDQNVLCFEEDNEGKLWIGTRNGGLNILDKSSLLNNKDVSIKWYLPKSDGTSVYNRTVSSIKKDDKGNMWLGTSTGVNFVNPRDEPVKLLQNKTADRETLSHNRIGSLAQASNNNIWIGTDGGGLDLMNLKTGTFKHYRHQNDNPNSLSNNYIISVFEDSQKRVWVGTYQGGLNRLDTLTGNTKKYLEDIDIRVIFEDQKNQIWVGTNRAGLFIYDERKDTFKQIEKLRALDIRDIEQGSENSLWIATFGNGILGFNTASQEVVYFDTNTLEGFPTDVFLSILPLNNEDLLLGSRYEGLIRFNPATKSFSIFTEADGLSNNTITSIVQENKNFVWLGTSRGINRFNILNNKTYDLSALNNVQTSEFNVGAVLKTSNGRLYFGGNKGLNIIYPKRLKRDDKDYNLVFQNFLIYNEPVPILPEDKKSVLDASITYEDEINLNHDQSLFTISFTILKYPEAKDINYSYILEGYHENWIKLKGNGVANFSQTPPGEYALKVKALMNSGQEITNELDIIIHPPFWKTLPAYILYVLLIIVFLLLGMKYYSERLKLKTSLAFEKKQRQLEHDLNEERIHFFTNFSHELKTPLTLILAPLEDLLNQLKKEKHLKKVRLVKKNAENLHSIISKLLKFRKAETGLSQLVISTHNLSKLLEQTYLNFKPLAKKKKIQFHLSLPKEEVIVNLDVEKFQIIINNLVSNAFKHCKENDEITFQLIDTNHSIKIQVKDTGPGINEKDLPYIFDWYYQSGKSPKKKGTGIGLALTKSFVELHNGTVNVINNTETSGVTFTFEIPKNEELSTTLREHTSEDNELEELWGVSTMEESEEENYKNIKLKKDRKLVLLVEDNKDIIHYIESILEEEYDLILSYNGKDGIEKATEYIPDLIISDVMMPQKSGIDLCHHLKNQMSTTHIPIILLTAKTNTESIMTGYEEGADDYITKPFNSEILKTRVHNLLKNREKLKTYFTSKESELSELSSSSLKLLDKEKQFLSKLKSIILEHLKTDKINVDIVAQHIGMSRSSLYRKITAITGNNINDYIKKVRIEKACHLIKHENMTISQASYEVGFKSVKYFRKIFKEELGVLPSTYKKKKHS